MIVTWPEDCVLLLGVRDRELLLAKYGVFGVCMGGEVGPKDIESKVLAGVAVLARSSCAGRPMGGFGAGPGFMNWSAE